LILSGPAIPLPALLEQITGFVQSQVPRNLVILAERLDETSTIEKDEYVATRLSKAAPFHGRAHDETEDHKVSGFFGRIDRSSLQSFRFKTDTCYSLSHGKQVHTLSVCSSRMPVCTTGTSRR